MTRFRVILPALATLALVVAAPVGIMSWAAPAQAASIVVNTTDDESNADGDCSLREAIEAGNTDLAVDACTAGSGADIITLPAGTYTLTLGQLPTITSDITINGAGSATTIVDANDNGRAFQYELPSASAGGLNDLTIQNGSSGDGAGIFIDAIVAINNVVVQNNFADGDGGGIFIDTTGTLNATNCQVTGNEAASDGGGIANEGPDTLNLTDCTVSGNTASFDGGGISSIFDATGTIDRTTISGNTAGSDGGGVFIDQFGVGPFVITNSTISGNTSTDDDGGGMNVEAGEATLTNVTISGNSAADDGGGFRVDDPGIATLTNVTITGNTAPSESGGGVAVMAGGTATLLNTIVAQNAAGGDCFVEQGGTLTSSGNNLSGDDSCGFAAAGDLVNTNAQLSALALNAPGTTQTHALVAGSPPVDTGTNSGCPATDQRGVTRPQDGNLDGTATCDIGAYELEGAVTAAPTGTPTQAPAALPPTGGTPGSSSGLTWIALALGAAALAAGAFAFGRARR